MTERWLPISGYPDYEISDLGRVRSYKNNRWGTTDRPRTLRPKAKKPRRPGTAAYWVIRLRDAEGEIRALPVHLLVLSAFVGPRPEGKVTRHLNGDGMDNRLENLRYGTCRENALDDVAHGKHHWAARTHCKNGHEFTEDNLLPRRGSTRVCRECCRLAAERSNRKRRRVA